MAKRRRPINVEKEGGAPIDTDSGPRMAEGQGTAPIGSSGIWSEGIEDEAQGSEYLSPGVGGESGGIDPDEVDLDAGAPANDNDRR